MTPYVQMGKSGVSFSRWLTKDFFETDTLDRFEILEVDPGQTYRIQHFSTHATLGNGPNHELILSGTNFTLTSEGALSGEIRGIECVTWPPSGKFPPGFEAVISNIALDAQTLLQGFDTWSHGGAPVRKAINTLKSLADTAVGTDLNDWVRFTKGDKFNTVDLGEGDDVFFFQNGSVPLVQINGDNGQDTLVYEGASAITIYAGKAPDTGSGFFVVPQNFEHFRSLDADTDFRGSRDDDNFRSDNGNDTVRAGKGNDWIDTGRGADVIRGGHGDDVIAAGHGADMIFGGPGVDTYGVSIWSPQQISPEFVNLGAGFARDAAGDVDRLFSMENADGTAWGDTLIGSADDNWLRGREGADILLGRSGNDNLTGGKGRDTLYGGPGDDTLNGGAGPDVITGGGGRDSFEFHPDFGRDRITDFDVSKNQLLIHRDFQPGGPVQFTDLMRETHDGLLITFAQGDEVLLDGLTLSDAGLLEVAYFIMPAPI